jgi:hypothetical protein
VDKRADREYGKGALMMDAVSGTVHVKVELGKRVWLGFRGLAMNSCRTKEG